MWKLFYLVLIALLGIILDEILRPIIRRWLTIVSAWLEKYAPRLKRWWDGFHRSRFATPLRTFPTLLGLLTVLYVLAFVAFVFVGGKPTVDVPQQDIYVPPYEQRGEAWIVVRDESLRGLLFDSLFPPASLMRLKITPRQGQVTVIGAPSSEQNGSMVLKVHHGQVVVVQYSFSEGFLMGNVEVSVFGLSGDVVKTEPAATKIVTFKRTPE